MFKLYNGCPNKELQEYWDSIDTAKKYIRDSGFLITYYPIEGKYHMAYKDTYKLIGDFFNTPEQAAYWLKNELARAAS